MLARGNVKRLDALVEDLAPEVFKLQVRLQASEVVRIASEQHPAEWAQLSPEQQAAVEEALVGVMHQQITEPKFERVRGQGAARYEAVLATVGLDAPSDRPIPPDMDEALTEFSALRDVIVHRGGRIDQHALTAAPTLTMGEGELVRIGRDGYRRYAAALRTYGMEIARRLVGPSLVDLDLADWRQNYIVND